MKRNLKASVVVICVILIVVLSIWGPEKISNYRDKHTMNRVSMEELDGLGEGYRYELTNNEKLYILSMCLQHQVLPETDQSKKNRISNDNMDYEELNGSYAFVVNKKGPTDKEIDEKNIFRVCNQEIGVLKSMGILPDDIKVIENGAYEAELYSAIDVLDPRNNMPVWKVSLSTSHENADKSKRLLDAYVDAETGKIYEFYVRIEEEWEELEPEKIMKKWNEYLGLRGMEKDNRDNPLLETTPYFLKYTFPGMDNGKTIVTVGFYEGINELFLKISE
ncbi:MAG: hypothetical protein IKK33_12610 [Lachnospiraceae bacterium]|nr:hypothetical protein [Lachnospiraceae bacterium]